MSRAGQRRIRIFSQALHKNTGGNSSPWRPDSDSAPSGGIQIFSQGSSYLYKFRRGSSPWRSDSWAKEETESSGHTNFRHSDSCFTPGACVVSCSTMMKPPTPWPASALQHISSCVRRAFVRSDVSRNCFERLSNIFTCRPVRVSRPGCRMRVLLWLRHARLIDLRFTLLLPHAHLNVKRLIICLTRVSIVDASRQ